MRLPLTDGHEVLVDPDVYEWASKYTWRNVSRKGRVYASRSYWDKEVHIRRCVVLHREIMQPTPRQCVDHINGDTLDNRRANLRCCSHRQNCRNQKKAKHNTSGYKGVIHVKESGRWRARIRVNWRLINLGNHATAEAAALAYDRAAVRHFRQYAQLNFPEKKKLPARGPLCQYVAKKRRSEQQARAAARLKEKAGSTKYCPDEIKGEVKTD